MESLSFTLPGLIQQNEFMPQTLIFIYYIFATRCRRPLILKYKRFKPSGWKDIGISMLEKNLVSF